ncbi:unnamed protein product [Calicophoron daubneyi]|uniref:Uncharacterized protein n=1 Tax=Calicophoron daubneyi TaxID=300641 RepID=A0AAV2TX46_CALDB
MSMEKEIESQSFHRMSSQRRRKLWSLAARAAAKCPDETEKLTHSGPEASPLCGSGSLVKTQDSGVSVDYHSQEIHSTSFNSSMASGQHRVSFDIKFPRTRESITNQRIQRHRHSGARRRVMDNAASEDLYRQSIEEMKPRLHHLSVPARSFGGVSFEARAGTKSASQKWGSADTSGIGSSLDWMSTEAPHHQLTQHLSSPYLCENPMEIILPTRSFDSSLLYAHYRGENDPDHSVTDCKRRSVIDTSDSRLHFPLDQRRIRGLYPGLPYEQYPLKRPLANPHLSPQTSRPEQLQPSSLIGPRYAPLISRSFEHDRSCSQEWHHIRQSSRKFISQTTLPSVGTEPAFTFRKRRIDESATASSASWVSTVRNTPTRPAQQIPYDILTYSQHPGIQSEIVDSASLRHYERRHVDTPKFPCARAYTMDETVGRPSFRSCTSKRRGTLAMYPIPPPTDEFDEGNGFYHFHLQAEHHPVVLRDIHRSPEYAIRTLHAPSKIRPGASQQAVGLFHSEQGWDQPGWLKPRVDRSRRRHTEVGPQIPSLASSETRARIITRRTVSEEQQQEVNLRPIDEMKRLSTSDAVVSVSRPQAGRKRTIHLLDMDLRDVTRLAGADQQRGCLVQSAHSRDNHLSAPDLIVPSKISRMSKPVRPPHSSVPSKSFDYAIRSSSSDRPLVNPALIAAYSSAPPEEGRGVDRDKSAKPNLIAHHQVPRKITKAKSVQRQRSSELAQSSTDVHITEKSPQKELIPMKEIRHGREGEESPPIDDLITKAHVAPTPIMRHPSEGRTMDSHLGETSRKESEPPSPKYSPTLEPLHTSYRTSQIAEVRVSRPNLPTQPRPLATISTAELNEFADYWDHTVFTVARITAVGLASVASICMICSVGASTWIYEGSAENMTYSGFWKRCNYTTQSCNYTPPFFVEKTGWQDGVLCMLLFGIILGSLAIGLLLAGHVVYKLEKRLYYFHSSGETHVVSGLPAIPSRLTVSTKVCPDPKLLPETSPVNSWLSSFFPRTVHQIWVLLGN